ncbi:MAG TPA: molybdenum cofactor guanylyltransferase MobA [Azospirillaceae bacterium]|nr:molybdenum cofactor guanylyltransferase MobA [Azospirillaceae bacterium]
MTHPRSDTSALILAGGLARRMGGGDKGLRHLGGATLLDRVVAAVRPQVSTLILNANGDTARFADLDLPVVVDTVPGFAGPLAGVLAGLEWLAARPPGRAWLLTVPSDTPFLPADLARRLYDGAVREGAEIACAASAGQVHPVVALWPVSLAGTLRRILVDEGERRLQSVLARFRVATVEFPATPVDPFFNANTPEDLAEAERLLRGKPRDRQEGATRAGTG